MTNEEVVERGRRAAELLSSDILTTAFVGVRNNCIELWADTATHDQAARERYYMAVKVVGLVRDAIYGAVSQGQVAKAQIAAIAAQEKEESERQPKRRR